MRFNLLYTHKTKGKQHKNTYIYCCHHFDLTSLILFGLCRLPFLFFASCFVLFFPPFPSCSLGRLQTFLLLLLLCNNLL